MTAEKNKTRAITQIQPIQVRPNYYFQPTINRRGAKVEPITSVVVKTRCRDTDLNPHTTLGLTIQFDFLVKPIPCFYVICRVIAVLLFAANEKPNLNKNQINCVLTADSLFFFGFWTSTNYRRRSDITNVIISISFTVHANNCNS